MMITEKHYYCGYWWTFSVRKQPRRFELGITIASNAYERLALKLALGWLVLWVTWWKI